MHDAHPRTRRWRSRWRTCRPGPTSRRAIGVFRDVDRPVYGDAMDAQIERATERLGQGDLAKLLTGGDTWVVK